MGPYQLPVLAGMYHRVSPWSCSLTSEGEIVKAFVILVNEISV